MTSEAFAGRYRMLEDGWRSRLELVLMGERRLEGRYNNTDRDEKDYRCVVDVDPDIPHKMNMRIADYNEMPEQLFVGYLLRPGRNVITGITFAEGTTFGFVAHRTRSLVFASYRTGDVRPGDFAGSYSLHEEEGRGIIQLALGSDGALAGTYRRLGQMQEWPVAAQVDPSVRHGLIMRLEEPAARGERLFTGYLFTRPKNAIAGWVERGGEPSAFYMVKLNDHGSTSTSVPAG